jgi:MFS family permease
MDMKNSIYGFLVWLIATLFVIYAFCLNTAASVFQESIQSSLHLSNVGVSIAMGAFIVGFACMQIPAGYLLDRFNARYVVSFGVFLLAVGNVFISYSNNIVMFSLSNLIQGMGGSFAFIAVAVLISQWFPARYFPILFGLTQTLSCILSGILHYVMAQRLAVSTWNSLYQYLAIVGVILFLLTIAFVKSPANRSISTSVSLSTSLADVCKNKQIILCMLTAATSFGILLAYASLWYLPVQKFYEVNTSDSLIISSIIFAGIGIGTPLWGYISNLAKSRIMIIHVTLVLGTMMLLAGIYLPHFESHSLIFVKIVSFLIGLLLSGSMLLYTVVSEITTDNIRGVALSVTNTGVFLMNAGMMFIPLLFLTKTSQIFFTYLWVLPCSVMFSILLLYFIQESYRVSSS